LYENKDFSQSQAKATYEKKTAEHLFFLWQLFNELIPLPVRLPNQPNNTNLHFIRV